MVGLGEVVEVQEDTKIQTMLMVMEDQPCLEAEEMVTMLEEA
jgi:hypothetical protein